MKRSLVLLKIEKGMILVCVNSAKLKNLRTFKYEKNFDKTLQRLYYGI